MFRDDLLSRFKLLVSNLRPPSSDLLPSGDGPSSESVGPFVGEVRMGLSSFGSSSSQLGKTVLMGEPERALRVPPATDPDPDAVESVLSGGRELRRLDRRSFLMVGNEGAVPKRGGQLRSSRSIAIVDDEADGEGGADEGVWVNANEAREVGKGCLGDGTGERVGSVISRSLGVTGRRICLAMRGVSLWSPPR